VNSQYTLSPPTNTGQPRPAPNLTSTIVVRDGQTLGDIASCYNTTIARLQQENDLGDSTRIHIGEALIVPFLLARPRC
jgi:LysM repeat protein